MNILKDFFSNIPLVSALAAWLTAQIIKFITELIRYRKIDIEKLTGSGGMPSSHSAAVCALATSIGFYEGLNSVVFALAFMFGIIVMYDAMGVRREAGKQAQVLNKMIKDIFNDKPEYFQKNLKELVGHTPFQVLCGAILGVIVSLVFVKIFFAQ